eukprot:8741378-Pyramimonas_sp.AAC.1
MIFVFLKIQEYAGAAFTWVIRVEFPGMVLWHDPGSPRRNSQVDPWRWNMENNVLACVRVFTR